jgi:hypothetical protein
MMILMIVRCSKTTTTMIQYGRYHPLVLDIQLAGGMGIISLFSQCVLWRPTL